jgi:hypothetical protein
MSKILILDGSAIKISIVNKISIRIYNIPIAFISTVLDELVKIKASNIAKYFKSEYRILA